MKKHTFKLYLILGVLIVAGLGIGVSQIASARNVLFPPKPIYQDGVVERSTVTPDPLLLKVANDLLDIGSYVPVGSPPTDPPFAHFSGIDAPVWLSSTNTPQIASDLIMYGLNDVRGGFVNNRINREFHTCGWAEVGCPQPGYFIPQPGYFINKPLPLYIFDNVEIVGNNDASEKGSLTVNGAIIGNKTLDISEGGIVGGDLNVSGLITGGGFSTMGDISAPAGHFSAKSIGAFTNAWRKPEKNNYPNNIIKPENNYGQMMFNLADTWVTDTAFCPTPGGIVLACYPEFFYGGPSGSNNISWLPKGMGGNTCTVKVKQTKNDVLEFIAAAECFDPTQ